MRNRLSIIPWGRAICLVLLGMGLVACGASEPDTTGATLSSAAKPDALTVADVHCPACLDRPGATATCVGSQCIYTCTAERLDCDGKPANGCEVAKNSSIQHCGACGHACPVGEGSTALCLNGQCSFSCDSGWDDCLANVGGCETPVDADPNHCGDCTTVCAGGPHAKPHCEEGACKLACDGGFADCNGLTIDGCESNTASDGEHCGSCAMSCQGGKCVKGTCECASTSSTAQLLPLDLYIMMDQSGSMSAVTGSGMSKWQSIAEALKTFMQDKSSAGIGVGIQYFPLKGIGGSAVGGEKDSCSVSDYAKPEVAIAALPDTAADINDSVAKHSPGGGTPTAVALQGAINYAKSHSVANPTHTVIVVLATDGEPSECMPMDIPAIAQVASGGAQGSPKILTFVIGVGTSLTKLGAIAASGGSVQPFLVDQDGVDMVQQFSAALKSVQVAALACTYSIPLPEKGKTFDPTKVNVQVQFGENVPWVMVYVGMLAKCDPGTGGWYYDDPNAPTKIRLCQSMCTTLGTTPNAKVEILVGCSRLTKG